MSKNLLIAHKEPFEDSKFVRQLVNQYGVKEKEVTLYPCKNKDGLKKKIKKTSPKLVWLVGNTVRRMANVDMPFKVGHGRYTPMLNGNPLGMLIPTKKMVAKMPEKVKQEFCKRMDEFRDDWINRNLKDQHRADKRKLNAFAKSFDFKEDQDLKADKSYWVMYSGLAERHIIIVKKREHKEVFQKHIPFGVIMCQKEIASLQAEDKKLVSKVIRTFGCDGVEIKKT